ncbi:hypothetical protein AA313_de0204198 [Arthrobotrys entomopaga]|nr:hypothetical protein AA313_de0204198 [Arthrobotrys entomopaga]
MSKKLDIDLNVEMEEAPPLIHPSWPMDEMVWEPTGAPIVIFSPARWEPDPAIIKTQWYKAQRAELDEYIDLFVQAWNDLEEDEL